MAATPSQKQTLEAILAATETQTLAVLAMAAEIAAQASDIASAAMDARKAKNFARWQAEYLAGANTELVDIEDGTHVF